MGKFWFLERGFQTLQILAAHHWHSEEMHHGLGSKLSNSVGCPACGFQFSDLLAHVHILKCSNDSLANASAKSGSKTLPTIGWCLQDSFWFSWRELLAGFGYSCLINAWMHEKRPCSMCPKWFLVLFIVLACIVVRTGDQNRSVAKLNDETLPSRNEYASWLLHFLLD